jgi:hypothetical protein
MARHTGLARFTAALLLTMGMVAPVAVSEPAAAAPRSSGAQVLPAMAERASAAGAGGAALTAQNTAQATRLAATSDQPVEVLADRTDWSQTWAEPAGGYESQISAGPVRVEEPDGSWVPVDTTLSANPDGSVTPGAIVPGLSLSGGGSGPLMTVSQATGDPAGSVSVSWPFGSLPAPTLSGATATYANVLPSVNLLVTAEPTGVDAVLEVLSAAAAADPRLATIRFPTSAPGLTVSSDGQGGVTMTDSAGNALFSEPPAQMWDSAADVATSATPATGSAGSAPGISAPDGASAPADSSDPADLAGPEPGDHVGVAAVAVGSGSVSVSPVTSVLDGSSTVYPVVIDPGINYTTTQAGWLDVAHDFTGYSTNGSAGSCGAQGGAWTCWGNWDFQDPTGGIRAGFWCNGPVTPPVEPPPASNICYDSSPDSTWGVYRTFLNFNLPSGLAGADYVDAQLSVFDTWSYSCSENSIMQLWQTTQANQDASWGNQPTELDWQDSTTNAFGNKCNGGGITLNATNALTTAANNNSNEVTLELRAKSDTDTTAPPDLTNWRRFQATGSSCPQPGSGGYPCLQVFWMHTPDKATGQAAEGTFNAANGETDTHCSTGVNNPDYVNVNRPWLDASVTDQDSGLASFTTQIKYQQVFPGTGSSATFAGGVVQNDGSFRSQVPAGKFINDTEYEWQAQGVATAIDPVGGGQVVETGPLSSPCYVMVDLAEDQGVPDVVGTINVIHTGTATSTAPTSAPFLVGDTNYVIFSDPSYPALGPDNDLVGYLYAVGSSQPTQYVQATNGTANVPIRPYSEHAEDIYVRAVDAAGNLGPMNKDAGGSSIPNYSFTAATDGNTNIATMGYWPLNNTAADQSGDGNDLNLTPNAAFACGSTANVPGYTCSLGLEADTSGGVVSPESGFTVSAWATTDNWPCTNNTCVLMSEDSSQNNPNNTSVFWLAYQGSGSAGSPGSTVSCPCWVFEVWPSGDRSANPVVAARHVTAGQQQGDWTQLDGVYDPTLETGNVALYVNGDDSGTGDQQTISLTWPTTIPGPLRLGAGPPGNASWDPWAGNVSDACAIFGPLSNTLTPPGRAKSYIQLLYNGDGTSGSGADGCAWANQNYP